MRIGEPIARVFTLSWDDSEREPTDRLRSEASVELRTEEERPPGIELDSVGGGVDGRQPMYGDLQEEPERLAARKGGGASVCVHDWDSGRLDDWLTSCAGRGWLRCARSVTDGAVKYSTGRRAPR